MCTFVLFQSLLYEVVQQITLPQQGMIDEYIELESRTVHTEILQLGSFERLQIQVQGVIQRLLQLPFV